MILISSLKLISVQSLFSHGLVDVAVTLLWICCRVLAYQLKAFMKQVIENNYLSFCNNEHRIVQPCKETGAELQDIDVALRVVGVLYWLSWECSSRATLGVFSCHFCLQRCRPLEVSYCYAVFCFNLHCSFVSW